MSFGLIFFSSSDDEDEVTSELAMFTDACQAAYEASKPKLVRNPVERDRYGAHDRLVMAYFSEHPQYDESTFRNVGISSLMKCTSAIRQMAYGAVLDSLDEYLQMGATTALDSLRIFCKVIMNLYGEEFLRKPTYTDMEKLYAHHDEKHGFPGMLGSIDYPFILLEAIASQDLRIWHAFFGVSGMNNDVNVLRQSPIFNDLKSERASDVSFMANNVPYKRGYYLTDGIYAQWGVLIKSIKNPGTNDHKRILYKTRHQAARKDVEGAFGVLKTNPDIFPEEQHRDGDPVRTHEESMRVTEEIIDKTTHLIRALMVFKEGIFDDPKMVLSNWNALDSNPCSWGRVSCLNDHVNKMYASTTNALGFCRASPTKFADFSFNYLVGNIPKCLEYLPRASFPGNCIKYKDVTPRTPEQCGISPSASNKPPKPTGGDTTHHPTEDKRKPESSSSKPAWLLAIEVVTGVIVGSVFLAGLLLAAKKWKVKPRIIVQWKKSRTNKDHLEILIDLPTHCNVLALIDQVADLARLIHENISKLMGYCIEGVPFTRMLVFEYASNGTLSEHLHYEEGCQPLSWTRRMMMIVGISKGLKYLHTEIEPPFTIYELNSSAVYLTEDFSPKLVDFESWKTILTRSENNSSTISNEDAMCVQPSSLQARHLDIHGNIYSFGVLLLEIVTGRPPICKDKGFLVDWAKDHLEDPEKMASVVDPALKHFRVEDLEAIREVVRSCIHAGPSGLGAM
ncbi:probable LRR receptor-like serine/threonine-protein kinase [Tanacetum coccineum]|uniref:Probable LRR receptor-like serine/threonine-protein kinase n=1 Tax=Tanacetum coccineum TaxID=301880 RepID=A0ABQ5BAP1_9ASTR